MQAANDQLQSLRTLQEQTVIYRHDMRHHVTLLYGFAKDGDLQKIKDYLASSEMKIDEMTPTYHCQNEIVDLLVTAFEDSELCSLISNALENAITAYSILKHTLKKGNHHIDVKNNNLLISTENPYEDILKKEEIISTLLLKEKVMDMALSV